MVEITDTPKKTEDTVTPGADAAAKNAAPVSPETPSDLSHTKIKGRFNQFQSGYWSLAVPLLSARYTADAVNEMMKVGRKSDGANFSLRHIFEHSPKSSKSDIMKDSAWAIVVGVIMNLVTAFYTASTYGDMKRQFKEPLAWEFDKDPAKVGLIDMFKSKNVLVNDAAKNFARRTGMRFLADLPFFAWTVGSPFRDKEGNYIKIDEDQDYTRLLGPKGSVNLGVGVNAMYLASDSFLRKRTFFEELQSFIDNKLNHADRLGDQVTAQDLLNLYDRQARTNKQALPLPAMNTPEWDNDMKLFGRMADLMNQTYGNVAKHEHADFTVPKLIYLLGMGLEKSKDPAKNLAYLEVANAYGIPAVKKMAKAIKDGASVSSALAAFPIAPAAQETSTGFTTADNRLLSSMEPVAEKSGKLFADESLKRPRPEASPASHVEKAAQENAIGMGLSA